MLPAVVAFFLLIGSAGLGAMVMEEYPHVTSNEAQAREARAAGFNKIAESHDESAEEYRSLAASYGAGSGLCCVLSLATGVGALVWFTRRKREDL